MDILLIIQLSALNIRFIRGMRYKARLQRSEIKPVVIQDG